MIQDTKSSSLLKGFYHLKMAQELWADFVRTYPNTKGSAFVEGGIKRLKWLETAFATSQMMPSEVGAAMRKEMSGDVLFPMAISEKCLLLSPEHRETLENVVDLLIDGHSLMVEKIQ